MKTLELLKLWALGLGIPLSVFEDERMKFELSLNDPHGCLDELKNIISANPEWKEANQVIFNPFYQLEFVSLFR